MSVLGWVRLMGVVVLCSFALSGWAIVKAARAEATQAAQTASGNTQQVATCYRQLDTIPDLIRVLGLIQTLATNSITTSKAALEIREPDDPLNKVSRDSIRRLTPGVGSVTRFIEQTRDNAPSEQECAHLAESLGVDPDDVK